MLERAFAARFGGADAAPSHPLAPGNRAAWAAAGESAPAASSAAAATAATGATAAGSAPSADGQTPDVQHQQQQAAHPDVPSPSNATLAPTAVPEHGKPKDPDAPLATGGRVPRYIRNTTTTPQVCLLVQVVMPHERMQSIQLLKCSSILIGVWVQC